MKESSYEIEDGYPKYTQCVTNNSDGLSIQYAMSRYMASAYGGPFIQDKREYEQYLYYPEQKEAVALWSRKAGRGSFAAPGRHGNRCGRSGECH